MSDLRQAKEYAHYTEKIGWQVEKISVGQKSFQVFLRHLPLLGSFIKIQRPTTISFPKIEALAKKHHAFQIVIEPSIKQQAKEASRYGFSLSRSPFLPTKTLQINLLDEEKIIFAKMKKDAKYALRKIKFGSAGQLVELEDLEKFRLAWKKAASWKRWIPPLSYLKSLKTAFGKKAIFLTAKNEAPSGLRSGYLLPMLRRERNPFEAEISSHSSSGLRPRFSAKGDKNILAGVTLLINDKVAYYYFAFSTRVGKKLSLPYFLVWEAIKLAKKEGCRIFDFEGIYDERFPQKSWQGFTHFKKSFGGKEVESPPPLVKFYHPFWRVLGFFLR